MTLSGRLPALDVSVDITSSISRLLILLRALRSNLNDLEYVVTEMVDVIDPPSPSIG